MKAYTLNEIENNFSGNKQIPYRVKLTVKVETDNDGYMSASVRGSGFLLTTTGYNIEEVEENLRDLIADYLANEGRDNTDWLGIYVDDIKLVIERL